MRRIQQVLDELAEPGIVAELRDPEPWFGTAGVADLSTGRLREPGEHFRIGSFTKAFASTAVLLVTAEGKLSLDDTVAQWLPGLVEEYFPGADGSAISLRQLLNHTSGLPDALPDQPTPPAEAPGKHFIYSKVNYNLAEMIVEQATGSTLADEIDRPLNLNGTYLPSTETTVRAPHARHYTEQDHDVTEIDVSWAGAAGGMISTTSDLQRFLRALLAGELLPSAQQKEMFTTVPTADWVPDTRYGLGVYSQRLASGVVLWGGGGYITGSMTYAMGDRDGATTLVANLNGDWTDFLGTFTTLFEAVF